MSNIVTALATITSLWGESVTSANASTTPIVLEVPMSLRNVFPAVNFNRDVTTTWWQTAVLNGHDADAATEVTAALREASYIVLDKDMYEVRMTPARNKALYDTP